LRFKPTGIWFRSTREGRFVARCSKNGRQSNWFHPIAPNRDSGVSSGPDNPQVWGETLFLRSEYWLRLNPWSPQALLVALTGVVIAVAIRVALQPFGVDLYFAPFFPAILLTSLIAGVPAGIFSALSAVVVVWWAFMPPMFEFGALGAEDVDRFQLFLLSVSVLIWFSDLCRTIARMRARS
jgi:hypothetical protein